MSMAWLAAIVLLGAVQLWPIFRDSLGALWRGTPTLAMLRHVEGPVTSIGACWTQSRRAGGQRVVSLHVADSTGSVPLVVPCLFEPDTLRHGPHRLAVDVDPQGLAPGQIYQMVLDDRPLVAYADSRATQARGGRIVALVGVGVPLLFAGAVAWVLVQRRRAGS